MELAEAAKKFSGNGTLYLRKNHAPTQSSLATIAWKKSEPTEDNEDDGVVDDTLVSIESAEATSATEPLECTKQNPRTGLPCDRTFTRTYDLVRHQKAVHEEAQIVCLECPDRKSFSRQDALYRHERIVHGVKHRKTIGGRVQKR